MIVGFAAGIAALVAGVIWGERSNLSFDLQIVSSKALPVLIFCGFASVLRAYVAGLVNGYMERLSGFYRSLWWEPRLRVGWRICCFDWCGRRKCLGSG